MRKRAGLLLFAGLLGLTAMAETKGPDIMVEIEEDVYSFDPADNGAGPLWAHGNTCVVRAGDRVFASGLETLPEEKPLNNTRWLLFERGTSGWKKLFRADGRTREPCPLGVYPSGRLLLSDNPTLTESGIYGGPAEPKILTFMASDPTAGYVRRTPTWEGAPDFREHSYRSFAADGANEELILLQNIGYTHAEWAFLDREGTWSARGKLPWPDGAEYPKPQPIRTCYPTVALKDKRVYFCGVSDIVEPYPEWREFKEKLTGRKWDYDFRRLFFTWSDDITTGKFHDWIEVASRDKTAGWIFPCDLWVDPQGDVHILWSERAIDERLKEEFFPDEEQSICLNYAVLREGKTLRQIALHPQGEREFEETSSRGRFHVAKNGRLLVLFHVSGTNHEGEAVNENRILSLTSDGTPTSSTTVALDPPFSSFYTSTWRAGCPPSDLVDIYGQRSGKGNTMSYARLRLMETP